MMMMMMQRLFALLVIVAVCVAPLWAQATEPKPWEQTPASLGWGPDDRAYPDKEIVGPDGGKYVWVPAGEFTMGSTAEEREWAYQKARETFGDAAQREWYDDGQPAHRVTLTRGFWLGACEVTNVQFRSFRPSYDSGSIAGLSLNGDEQAVVQVSWEDAKAYCDHFGLRLPTEAEWEYACRAGSTGKFWWGDSETEAGKYANVTDRTFRAKLTMEFNGHPWPIFDTDDGYAVTAPVGSYRPNAFGLHDMIGNVCEWCADWHDASYYASSPGSDPAGPATGTQRVSRGGSWCYTPEVCRSANRYGYNPVYRLDYLGFRCVVPSK